MSFQYTALLQVISMNICGDLIILVYVYSLLCYSVHNVHIRRYCGDKDADHLKSNCPHVKVVYLIRHCQSTGNIARGTSYDPLLTNHGLLQAIGLKKHTKLWK